MAFLCFTIDILREYTVNKMVILSKIFCLRVYMFFQEYLLAKEKDEIGLFMYQLLDIFW